MADADFPDDLCAFIQDNIPSLEAAEVLLFLAARRSASWTAERIVAELKPAAVADAEARQSLARFKSRGLVAENAAAFQYAASEDQDRLVQGLRKAYNERPVTFVRMIYTLRDLRIQSFADAFKLKKD